MGQSFWQRPLGDFLLSTWNAIEFALYAGPAYGLYKCNQPSVWQRITGGTLVVLLLASPAFAESRVQLPTQAERTIADVASYGSLGAALAMDAWSCRSAADQRHCYLMTAVRDGVTVGASEVIKRVVHRDRPCAPSCGIDTANASFWSEHTALAFSTLGQVNLPQFGGQSSGPRLAFVVPLAVSTGGLRVAAGKHWISDTLVGAGVGLLTSRIR